MSSKPVPGGQRSGQLEQPEYQRPNLHLELQVAASSLDSGQPIKASRTKNRRLVRTDLYALIHRVPVHLRHLWTHSSGRVGAAPWKPDPTTTECGKPR